MIDCTPPIPHPIPTMPFVAFYKQLPQEHVKYELLLYHEYGKEKWEKCGKAYTMADGFVKEEIREAYEKAYRDNGLKVIRT